MKIRRLFESGSSIVVAIPIEMRKAANMKKGDTVLLTMKDTDTIEIRSVSQEKMLSLVRAGGQDG